MQININFEHCIFGKVWKWTLYVEIWITCAFFLFLLLLLFLFFLHDMLAHDVCCFLLAAPQRGGGGGGGLGLWKEMIIIIEKEWVHVIWTKSHFTRPSRRISVIGINIFLAIEIMIEVNYLYMWYTLFRFKSRNMKRILFLCINWHV